MKIIEDAKTVSVFMVKFIIVCFSMITVGVSWIPYSDNNEMRSGISDVFSFRIDSTYTYGLVLIFVGMIFGIFSIVLRKSYPELSHKFSVIAYIFCGVGSLPAMSAWS